MPRINTMNASSITIRRAVLDDVTAIANVHVATWRTTYFGIVDQAYLDSLSTDARAAMWARLLSTDAQTAPDVLVAVAADGRIVGFASGGVSRESLYGFDSELHAIYLLEPFQHVGIGRRLVRDWAALAVSRGFRAAIVRVLATNPSLLFYERLGAEYLRETQVTIGDQPHAEAWYGWRDLLALTA
jgi:GNAT superfamily N-acetyltransferase